ncbi:MAG TPA: multiheme c-type cytochrome [Bacteroidales bacterium]|nr:multiheme c-type cytochrome [Bacteroidales bacterium]
MKMNAPKSKILLLLLPIFLLVVLFAFKAIYPGLDESLKGKYSYDDFESAEKCKSCHTGFYQQWSQSMMSQAYTHKWDEIEYFKLAEAHAKKVPALKEVVDGCNGCHTPMAFMAGKLPPAKPEEGTMANESVSCEVCHLVKGTTADPPHNFSYIIEPGNTKHSSRKGTKDSPAHNIVTNDLFRTTEFCANCHNEKSPGGVWVKSTQLEWKEGPYSDEGVRCQDCHMPVANFKTAIMGNTYKDARLHLFHGAHAKGKVRGTIEVRIQPDIRETVPGEEVVFTVALFNQKTGHKFPTGSVEDRIVWLHVEATDAEGNVYHLPVDKKGFEGEQYTIAADTLAYQDMGVPLGLADFKGVQRDGVPVGDRIFRMPYFDPEGRMTIMQWNTDSLGVDYRIGPRETKIETYTFQVPFETAPGKMSVKAVLNYQLLVKPVGELLEVPAEEYEPLVVNQHSTNVTIYQ